MKHFLLVTFLFLSSAVFANEQLYININVNKLDTINVENDQVWLATEVQPVFPGGEAALITFIGTNVRYPAKAREYRIEGNVYVSFVIEKDGSVTNVKVIRGIGGSCDEEAKRVISLLPNFIPGKQNGVPVRVQQIVPISFKLSSKP